MLEVTVYNVQTLGKNVIEEYPNHELHKARGLAVELAIAGAPEQRVMVMSNGWLPLFEASPAGGSV